MKYFIGVVISIVFVGIIVAFVSIGSPSAQRERRLDKMRVNHLLMMQSELLRYWQSKGALPAEVSQLKDDISGWQVPTDPVSGEQYEYAVKGDTSFQLCANFMRASEESGEPRYPMMQKPMMAPYPSGPFGVSGDVWSHGMGRVCFERTIDKELYPFVPPQKLFPQYK